MREDWAIKRMIPYVRSMSVFKPYVEFENNDFASIVQDMKLHKVRRGTRITNYGDYADTVYLIVGGRIAITYPRIDLKLQIA